MAKGKALDGKPYAGNPYVRFDEWEVVSTATPSHGSLHCINSIQRREFIRGACVAGVSLFAMRSEMLFGEERLDESCVRAGLVADIHYSDMPDNDNRYYVESEAKLKESVSVMNKVGPDFMVELGDLKDISKNKAATVKCLDRIESVFAGFRGDRFHVPGNHDFDCFSPKEFFGHIHNSGQDVAQGYYSFVRGGITFIVLDGNYTKDFVHYAGDVPWDWTDSNIPPDELKWLESELVKAKVAVVFCHQRLDNKAREYHEVKNAADVRNMLERSGKVKSVITGHDHIGGLCTINGITYYTLRAMIEGSGEKQNSYAVASFYSDGTMSVKGWRLAMSLPRV